MSTNGMERETNLRQSLMDRLISASINEELVARNAMLERWRRIGHGMRTATQARGAIDGTDS